MSTARVLSISVPVETSPATTFFQIRFNVDGSTSWTGYDPASASPTVPADINVSTLSSGVYLLDGINGSGGNQAAASYAGNWYQLRLKSAGGYSDWSVPFKVGAEPDDDGPFADVAKLIRDFADLKTMLDFSTQAQADEFLSEALTDAMDELREDAEVEALYVGSPTASQTRKLTAAELLMAKALVWEKAGDMKAGGMQAPLLMEDSEVMERRAEYYRSRALARISNLTDNDQGITSVFAFPAAGSSTFTALDSDRTPYERNQLQDEIGDGISASDLVNG